MSQEAHDGGPPPAGEARDTAALLMHLTQLTLDNFEAVAASFGLTTAQARALLALEGPAPMRFLADYLRCNASYVTGIVDALESNHLVVRAVPDGDRRMKVLELTSEGRRTRTALEKAMLKASPVMTGLDAAERHQLRSLLNKAIADPDSSHHSVQS
ncbi:MAG TPA: MarR family transcriptional regulator [Jiangellales bacterium]|nr:MarR family transcriptional regulator [Jiangellales bacterium]